MKKLLLTLALLGAIAPQIARADEPMVNQAPGVAALATVTPFIEALKEPQGLALDNNGDIIVCDYVAGEVLRFSATGQKKEVLATGLKGPSQIIKTPKYYDLSSSESNPGWIVSERKANRVVGLGSGQRLVVIGDNVVEPMGLLATLPDGLFAPIRVVAHTTSKIYENRGKTDEWKLVYAAPDEDAGAGRYGLRCLAGDGDTVFVSDEVNGDILMISRGGRMAKFASGFDDPSGLAIRGDWLYVCDEGNGGQLWKVNKNGVKILVAEKLGRPRNVLFLDDKTALVSDRDGRVLKLSWAN